MKALAVALLIASVIPSRSLNVNLTPANIGVLHEMACHNFGRQIRINIDLIWPKNHLHAGQKGLVFWTYNEVHDSAEYTFPAGSYRFFRGHYAITGSFFPYWAGVHAGTTSIAFLTSPSEHPGNMPQPTDGCP